MAAGRAYDTLCDKLERYVAPFVDFISEEEEKELKERRKRRREAAEEATGKTLEDEFLPPDPCTLRMIRLKAGTECIASSWSETLRLLYKERGEIQLRDCLLPEELGGASSPWNNELSRFGFNHEQVENILRNFGQQEVKNSVELPWGGYVIRVADGFKLSESYNKNI